MKDIPQLPPIGRQLTLDGITLGHGSDETGKTGVTVIMAPEGVRAAAEVRGSATGTRQFDSLVSPVHIATRAHAVVLAGGSGFGLDAGSPVVQELAARGKGFRTGYGPVPLVPTAILFDLSFGDPRAVPGEKLVRAAMAEADSGPVAVGSVGAGTGATVGKALGPEQAMKGGFGFASLTVPGGPTVAAAVAVNALGDVRHPDRGTPLAGCRTHADGLELAGTDRLMAAMPPATASAWEGNTTLATVLTDADLDKVALLKVCQMAFGGFYRCFVPALSPYDGDLVVALATGRVPAHVNQIGVLAERAVAEAIVCAVTEADGFGLLPTARDLNPSG